MWDVLGIAPTTDIIKIRRAYAAKLRSIGGDCDPAAFVRVRKAYEAALAWQDAAVDSLVTFAADEMEDTEDAEDADDPIASESSAGNPADDGLIDFPVKREDQSLPIQAGDDEPTLADFDQAIARKSTIDAGRCLDRLMAWGVIGIGDERAALRLAEFALHDLDLPAETFAELVGHLGLDGKTHGDDGAPRLRHLIRERLAADSWLSALRTTAAKRAWGKAREEVRIARAFVGTARTRRLPGIKSGRLGKTIEEFQRHRSWIGHRMNLDRIATLEARFQRVMRRRRRREKIYAVFVWFFVAFMVLDLIFVLVTGGVKGK